MREEKLVPLKWFVTALGLCAGALASAFYIGRSIQTVDSRLIANELAVEDINKELQFRISLRNQLMDRLNSIDNRLSVIEGRLYRSKP